MSEINVVPYIDVMLVLLIIFMVTAPLMNLGVEVNLPEAAAEPMSDDSGDPLTVTVTAGGELYLDTGAAPAPVDEQTLVESVGAVVARHRPLEEVVDGERDVACQPISAATTFSQRAGVSAIGLVGDPPENN